MTESQDSIIENSESDKWHLRLRCLEMAIAFVPNQNDINRILTTAKAFYSFTHGPIKAETLIGKKL